MVILLSGVLISYLCAVYAARMPRRAICNRPSRAVPVYPSPSVVCTLPASYISAECTEVSCVCPGGLPLPLQDRAIVLHLRTHYNTQDCGAAAR